VKISAVALAIALCRPGLPPKYAQIIAEGSQKLGIDPLMVIYIAKHESGWLQNAVSPDGEDYGLGQIRARYRPACSKDKDPVHAPSAVCKEEKKELLDGAYNLQVMFSAIEFWLTFCKAKTGKATEEAFLWAYSGLNRPKQGKWCGQQAMEGGKWVPLATHSLVKTFLAGRRALRLRLEALPLPPGP